MATTHLGATTLIPGAPVGPAADDYELVTTTAQQGFVDGPSTQDTAFGTIDIGWEYIYSQNLSSVSNTWTAQLIVSAISGTVTGRWRLARYNSAGTLQSSTAWSADFTTTGTKTLNTTWDPGAWAPNDRLILEVDYYRSGGHGNVSMSFEVGDTQTFVNAPIETFDQAGVRLRNDDGNETTATWKAAENTAADIALDENFRARFVVDETSVLAALLAPVIEYRRNGGSWTTVGTTPGAQPVTVTASPNLADNTATTRQLTSGTGTFVAGFFEEVSITTAAVTFPAGGLTEFEWCLQLDSAGGATAGDTIELRLRYNNGAAFTTYTNLATINVTGPITIPITGTSGTNGQRSRVAMPAGPWRAPNGALYVIIHEDNTTPEQIEVYKNSGAGWSNVATHVLTGDEISVGTFGPSAPIGDLIPIMHQTITSNEYRYSVYDTSTDTFTITEELAYTSDSGSPTSGAAATEPALFADGRIVYGLWNQTTRKLQFATRPNIDGAGTWTVATHASGFTTASMGDYALIVDSGDKAHLVGSQPVGDRITHVTMTSGGTVSALQEAALGYDQLNYQSITRIWEDGSRLYVLFAIDNDTDQASQSRLLRSSSLADAPTWTDEGSINTTWMNSQSGTTGYHHGALPVVIPVGNAQFVYRVGQTYQAGTQDIIATEWQGGTTWGADSTIFSPLAPFLLAAGFSYHGWYDGSNLFIGGMIETSTVRQWEVFTVDLGMSPVQIKQHTTDVYLEPPPPTSQAAYRFRDHANAYDHALNSASFGIAENTAWTLAETARRFALRIAIAETATSAAAYKLQYRIDTTGTGASYGAWTDVHVNNPGSADDLRTTVDPVEIVPNSTWADGAATTDVIGGAGTFVAGEGKDTGITTGVIALTADTHTELEWSLWMHRWKGSTRSEIVPDGSLVQFRVVESDGTLLDGYTATPQLTVAHRTGFLGGIIGESPDQILAEASNGDLYGLLEFEAYSALPLMMKSTDGGLTWNGVDLANGPVSTDFEGVGICLSSDGTAIHIAHFQTGGTDSIVYHRFNMSTAGANPDTWQEIDTVVDNSAGVGLVLEQFCSIVNLGSDDLRLFYSSHPDTRDHIYYKDRISGTWDVSPNAGWNPPTAVDVVPAWIMRDDTNGITYLMTMWDDAVGGGIAGKAITDAEAHTDLFGNSIGTGNQGTLIADNTGDSAAYRLNGAPPATWYDASTFMAFVVYGDEANGDRLSGNLLTLGAGGSVGTQRNVSGTEIQIGNGQSRMPVTSIIRDSATGNLYAFYGKDTAQAYLDSDIFYKVSTDDGVTWGTEQTLATNAWGSRPNWIRGIEAVQNGVVGLLVDDANSYEMDASIVGANAGFTGGFVFYETVALSAPPVTRTHTTDVLLKATSTLDHTTDVVKVSVETLTHTTDVVLNATLTLVHTTDVLLQATEALTHTTDVVLQATETLTHTTDVVKTGQFTVAHTSDVLLQATEVLTHTTDVDLLGTLTLVHTTDAVLQATELLTHTTDVVLEVVNMLTHTTDVLLQATVATDHTADVFLVDRLTVTHSTDVIALATLQLSHTSDVYLVDRLTLAHTSDVLLQATEVVDHTADVFLVDRLTLVHTTDALFKATVLLTHTTDVLKEQAGQVTHSTDVLLQATEAISHTADAFLVDRITTSHTTDVFLSSGNEVAHTADVYLVDRLTLIHTTDVITSSSGLLVHTTDVLLKATEVTEHTTDVIAVDRLTLDHTTDVVLQVTLSETHTSDVFLVDRLTLVHTSDVLAQATETRTHTTDVFLSASGTVVHQTDVVLLGTNTQTHSTDVVLQATETVTHTSDALFYAQLSLTHSTDILLYATVGLSHSTDVVLLATETVTHSTDLILAARLTLDHTTDVLLESVVSITHTTDVLLKATETLAHTTDLLMSTGVTRHHSTDVFLYLEVTYAPRGVISTERYDVVGKEPVRGFSIQPADIISQE